MYGAKLKIPTQKDSDRVFQDYVADAGRRADHDEKHPDQPPQLKPGENVGRENGMPIVSGHVAVTSINGALAKMVYERNLNREFYLEESFSNDWMNPYLSPHKLILKLNREKTALGVRMNLAAGQQQS